MPRNQSLFISLNEILALIGLGHVDAESNVSACDAPDSEPQPAPRVKLCQSLLTATEFYFFQVLREAVGQHYHISCKVRLRDIFVPATHEWDFEIINHYKQKHVDFLLCDPDTMQPKLAVELDDRSHRREKTRQRDALVEQLYRDACLPLMRWPANGYYDVNELWSSIVSHVSVDLHIYEEPAAPYDAAKPVQEEPRFPPTCPKCEQEMVPRIATKGKNAGEPFFGCPNFPRCRHIERAA